MSYNSDSAKTMQNYRETTVLFTWIANDRLKQYLTEHLRQISNLRLIFPEESEDTSPENLVKLAPNADIIVGWRPTKELLLAAKRLTLYINPGAGVQHLIEPFREINQTRPILLANGHGNSYFTAQHVVALLFSLANKIISHHNWMTDGLWRKRDDDARSIPIRSRQIGLLGYGAINQKVHRFLAGFDIEFAILRRTWDDQSKELATPAQRFTSPELQAFLEEIDTLLIAVPLTSTTKRMIGGPELDLLGPEGLLVNVARGEIVNQAALFTALKEKRIAGAALDVWYDYQPEPDDQGRKFPYQEQKHPFHRLDNVVLSPHRGASPLDDLKRWDEVIENINQFARGTENFINLVDLDQEY
ncbi:MAG: NAD(P)-dependent oxidoreductase [Candidatus Hodarchaeales archaeon]|jgi:phosphoglycerate dehydrogenase-like enzyme